MRALHGSEMVFPTGTKFFESEGVPYARLPDPDAPALNAFNGRLEEDPTFTFAPWSTRAISRADFNSLVDAEYDANAPVSSSDVTAKYTAK
jgi:hypothetical protein